MHDIVSGRSQHEAGPAAFAHLLRAEFARFCAGRSWVFLLGTAVVAFVLAAYFPALASHGQGAAVPTGPDGEAVADTYTVVHQSLTGDGTLTARVASLSGTGATLAPWAKAGLILEPDTNEGTDYAAVMVTGAHGVRMQDDYMHDSPGLPGAVGLSSPRWLRLARAGDLITGYDSTDGVHWTEIGTARLTDLPRTVQVGLFVTSPVDFAPGAVDGSPTLATAYFDQVSTQGDLPQRSWTGEVIAGFFYPSLQSGSSWRQQSVDVFTISGSGDIAPLVGDIISNNWSGASIVDGTIFCLLIVIVLAASYGTADHRRRSVPTTPVVSPHRALAARAVVLGSLVFAAGAIATAIAEVFTRHVLAANGIYLFPQSGPVVARVVIGTGLFLGLAAVLVLALGAMARRRLWTIVAGIVLLVVPGIIATLVRGSESWLMQFAPTAAFSVQATLPRSDVVTGAYTIVNGYFPIGPWVGLAVLGAYTAIAFGTASWLLRHQRAT